MATTEPSGSNLLHQARALPRNVWVLTGASFLTDVSTEMIVHLLPLFLANVLGVRTVTVGLIEGLAETTSSLVKLLSGRLSDRLQRRKGLTVAGYALSTVAKPFLALARSWPAVLLVRFVERVGKGVRTAPRDALVADSVGARQRGLAFGLHRAGDTAGAALGILIALLVVWRLQGHRVALEANTFTILVWASVLPALAAVVLLVLAVHEPRRAQPYAPQLPQLPYLPVASFRRYLLVVTLFTLGNASDAFLVLRAQSVGLGITAILALLLLFNLVYTIVSSPAGAVSDRLGPQRLLVTGWLLYAAIYAGFAFAGTAWHLAGLFALYGIYYGLTAGAARAFVADLVPASQRGTAYGWYNGAVGIAALPASLIAGLLWQGIGRWQGFGAPAAFLWGAALALLAALLLYRWFPPTRRVTV
ncbi:MAG: MFS transporter [Anaerolineae bacterium]|nr:MFS transporter [Anaerolineae bacterium]